MVLPEAGPVVGEENGIAGIGWIVLDAGCLANGNTLDMRLFFKAGHVLSGLVSDSRNGIGVVEELLRTVRLGNVAFAKQTRAFDWGRVGGGRGSTIGIAAIHDLEDVALYDAAHAIQIDAAVTFDGASVFRFFAEKKERSSSRHYNHAEHWENIAQMCDHASQRAPLRVASPRVMPSGSSRAALQSPRNISNINLPFPPPRCAACQCRQR